MSTLERAKAFAKRSTLSGAMSILPFALAAVNADAAAVTLTPQAYTPTVSITGLNFIAQTPFALTPTTVGDVAGQKLYGTGNFTLPFPGPSSIGAQVGPNLTVTAQGDASGTFTGDSVGVTWDFTLSELQFIICDEQCLFDSTGFAPFAWTITYSIGHSGGTASQQVSGSGGDGTYSGSSSITGLAGISPLTWSMVLSVDYSGSSGFRIDIPQNSVAIPGATQAIPEPGTVALMGAGFAVLAFRRFRRA